MQKVKKKKKFTKIDRSKVTIFIYENNLPVVLLFKRLLPQELLLLLLLLLLDVVVVFIACSWDLPSSHPFNTPWPELPEITKKLWFRLCSKKWYRLPNTGYRLCSKKCQRINFFTFIIFHNCIYKVILTYNFKT